jgi:acyl-CoA reductase-like NAD-dependent aldehyde dehydrogenase
VTRPLSFRKEQLRKLFYLVDDNKAELTTALYEDLAKPAQEAASGEINVMLMDIINVVQNVLPSQVANTA